MSACAQWHGGNEVVAWRQRSKKAKQRWQNSFFHFWKIHEFSKFRRGRYHLSFASGDTVWITIFRSNRFPNVNWKFFTLLYTDTNSPALNLFHICNIKVVQLFTCKYRVWSNPNSGKRKIASFCWKSIYCSEQTVGCFNDNIYYSVA